MLFLKRGLSGYDLKILGITLMLLDHTHQMFAHVGAPVWLTMVGRLVAPIFLFLSAEGFHYTHSKYRYMGNLLVGFWICNLLFYFLPQALPNPNILLMNSIFGTLFLGLVFMWIADGLFGKTKYIKTALIALLITIILSAIPLLLLSMPTINPTLVLLCTLFIPTLATVEGGISFVLLAMFLYLFREKRVLQYLTIALLSGFSFLTSRDSGQWMMIFSIIPLMCYNGNKGRSDKWFFYIFYPAHILILYLISTIFFL
ncbi:MAG: conjugal transfer protein TraX [Streptococcaceae bacterium]|jgi:hypothetical protein|nr:conjugal transfer protein TraX [Streptococcaceae bacterium]